MTGREVEENYILIHRSTKEILERVHIISYTCTRLRSKYCITFGIDQALNLQIMI